jgi:reactive intermediate/imine deaminase
MKYLLILLGALSMAGCGVDNNTDTSESISESKLESETDVSPAVEWLRAPGTEDLELPFSPAVRVGNTLYLSGALGIVPGTRNLAEGGILGETQQVLENISTTLDDFGSSMDNVVKCTVFLADIREWAAMNEIYTTFFPNKPARSAVGISGLGLSARVEIECIAVID